LIRAARLLRANSVSAAVRQHRSLRQAAEALNIRQSTLSRCLRDLEYNLGAIDF
jgi:DNA-binding transcriptional LysR family regulator